jgi:hypothetical protein
VRIGDYALWLHVGVSDFGNSYGVALQVLKKEWHWNLVSLKDMR